MVATENLIHGDCLEVLPTLPPVDLVLADPPYGTTMCTWDSIIPLKPLWVELKRIAKGAIVLNCSQPFTTTLISSNREMFKYCWTWQKTTPTGFLNAKKQPLRVIEDVCVFYQKQPIYNPQMRQGFKSYTVMQGDTKSSCYGEQTVAVSASLGERYPVTLIKFSKDRPKTHPTQKPVALMEYLVKTYTNEGDTVLDFCMGSGTTGVACRNLGREFIGIERNRSYFRLASERINGSDS